MVIYTTNGNTEYAVHLSTFGMHVRLLSASHQGERVAFDNTKKKMRAQGVVTFVAVTSSHLQLLHHAAAVRSGFVGFSSTRSAPHLQFLRPTAKSLAWRVARLVVAQKERH